MSVTQEHLLSLRDGTLRAESRPYSYQEAYLRPATVQCHASNLLRLPNGDLLCAWFGGNMEGKPDISIYLSRLASGGQNWGKAVKVSHDDTRSEQNPVLFHHPSGKLWLLYTSQHGGNQDSAVVKRVTSSDNGRSWSDANVLFDEPGTFIRQPVIVLDHGVLVVPTFKCRVEPGAKWIGNDDISAIRTSDDQGQTWSEIAIPESTGSVHMEIQRLRNGRYLALYRSRWADFIYSSTSPDGLQWSAPQATSLPNPNAGICFDVLPSGRVVVVYNHSSRKNAIGRREGLYDEITEGDDGRPNQKDRTDGKEAFWGAPRAPLTIAWSDDEGNAWKHRTLEEGDGYCLTNNSEHKLNRELSYPSMVVGEEGMIHISFTFWRQTIKYVQIKEDFFAA
ncbi:BNR repeat-like domain-containing protein [Aspergillus cavernicola]|uniref:BNR repeat-like domain-containing protein n=1 Tax=Aspergillus cavernicola TaxID=176166 RepID=A0ABR4IUK0_9EURO